MDLLVQQQPERHLPNPDEANAQQGDEEVRCLHANPYRGSYDEPCDRELGEEPPRAMTRKGLNLRAGRW